MENKPKTSIFCYPCFSDNRHDDFQKVLQLPNDHKHHDLSTWLKSELPEFKDRCAGIFSSKFRRHRHRGNPVAMFRYDSVDYALNFEDDDSHIDEYPLKLPFSSRLPSSPSPSPSPSSKEKLVVNNRQPRQVSTWS